MADSTRKRKWLWLSVRIVIWSGIVLLFLGGVLGRWREVQREKAAAIEERIAAELDAIRAAGYPTTPEELDKWLAHPKGPNAADVYLKAFAKLSEPNDEGSSGVEAFVAKLSELYDEDSDKKWLNVPVVGIGKLPALGERMPEKTKKLAAEFLASRAEVAVLLHEAAKIPECLYPDLYTGKGLFEIPHLGQARECSRQLKLQALLAAEEGQTGKAVDALDACFAVADSLRNERVVVGHLVRFACLSIATDGTERTMNRTPFTQAQRRILAARLAAAERPDAVWRSAAAERCTIDVNMASEAEAWEEIAAELPLGRLLSRSPVIQAKARLLNLLGQGCLISATRVPVEQRGRLVSVLAKELAAECEAAAGGSSDLAEAYQMFAGLGSERVVSEDVKIVAKLRAARTVLAVEAFREEQKRLPGSLGELVPKYIKAVPLDPFDGKPLRFKKRDKGYVVYSIGEDAEDDDGAHSLDEGMDWENADIPFGVVSPPKGPSGVE